MNGLINLQRIAIAAGIWVGLIGCSSAQTPATAINDTQPKPLLTAPIAPAAVESTQAADIQWDKYKGKVVYIDFWASWCGPCRQSFPWMNAMQQKYGQDGLVVLAINVDQEPAKAAQFLAENPATFTVKYDAAGKLAEKFGVQTMPSSFILDRSGKPASKHMGFHADSAIEYEREISALLAQKS